ncbi:MAG: Hpt domain-containing protein [Leptospiraceae bacterium]|nr:Hpt domain-containing protein [Leptospiraceae bacterium]
MQFQRNRYTLIGVLAGILFPVGALLIDWLIQGTEISLWQIPLINPIHFVIFSAPFVMGFMARLAGQREDRIQEQQSKLQQAHRDLARRAGEMRDIMRNIQEGILTLNPDGSINREYSLFLKSIFEKQELSGVNFVDLIYDQTRHQERKELHDYIAMLFENQNAASSLLEELNPVQSLDYVIQGQKGEVNLRHLQLHFVRILADDVLDKVMVIVHDNTAEVKKEKALKQEQQQHSEEIERVLALMDVPLAEIDTLHQKVARELKALEESLQSDRPTDAIVTILNQLHSLKGESRLFGLHRLGDLIHGMEARCRQYSDDADSTIQDLNLDLKMEVMLQISQTRIYLADLEQTRGKVIGKMNEHNQTSPQANKRFTEWIQGEFIPELRQAQGSLDALLQHTVQKMAAWSDADAKPPQSVNLDWLNNLDSFLQQGIQELAQSAVERQLKPLRIDCQLAPRELESLPILRPAVIHLLQNALAHGIESPAERQRKGKDVAGQIELHLHRGESAEILIRVKDDGRGLDAAQIKQNLLDQGKIVASELDAMDKSSLMRHIFESGFSTSGAQVTPVAGHGLGMQAVRDLVHQLHGQIEIHNRKGHGMSIVLRIPAPDEQKASKT